jgi:hypothetical protein
LIQSDETSYPTDLPTRPDDSKALKTLLKTGRFQSLAYGTPLVQSILDILMVATVFEDFRLVGGTAPSL